MGVRLISEGVTIERIEADDRSGRARIVDEYTFSDTKLPVVNPIESRFRFEHGRIVEHRDACDARQSYVIALEAFLVGGALTFVARQQTAVRQLHKTAERERIARDLHDILGHSLS